jgi:hypothetical protein
MTTKSKLPSYVRKSVKRATDIYLREFPRGPYHTRPYGARVDVLNEDGVLICSAPSGRFAVSIAQILHLYDVARASTPPVAHALPGVPENSQNVRTPLGAILARPEAPKLTTREDMRHAEELLEIAAGLAHNELSGQVPRHTSTPAEIAEFRAKARKTLRLAAINYVRKLEASGQPPPKADDGEVTE